MYFWKSASVLAVHERVTRLLHDDAANPEGAEGGLGRVVTVIEFEFPLVPLTLYALIR